MIAVEICYLLWFFSKNLVEYYGKTRQILLTLLSLLSTISTERDSKEKFLLYITWKTSHWIPFIWQKKTAPCFPFLLKWYWTKKGGWAAFAWFTISRTEKTFRPISLNMWHTVSVYIEHAFREIAHLLQRLLQLQSQWSVKISTDFSPQCMCCNFSVTSLSAVTCLQTGNFDKSSNWI